jgi:hypothetical protein
VFMLPEKTDARWNYLVTGQKNYRLQTVPASMLLSRIIRSVQADNSPENIQRCIEEAYNFFMRYEAILDRDIKTIFDS